MSRARPEFIASHPDRARLGQPDRHLFTGRNSASALSDVGLNRFGIGAASRRLAAARASASTRIRWLRAK